jgi:UDP-N-acetylglucosamine 4,6-dehydratase/5-epimerase
VHSSVLTLALIPCFSQEDAQMFSNKTLLITGGTGSFGNAVLRRFLVTDVNEIRIFSRDELKQDDMRVSLNSPKVSFYLGDVRDYDSLSTAMSGVDYVFHAAALKQVPSCEFYPMEAVKTNVLGAENVYNAAITNQVEKVISLSTDKAVYPINAMGVSKAMMEKLMIATARRATPNATRLSGTRYGNVMGTRGSVIPLFMKQIREGSPITVTEPTMTRFLMSLDDAVDLVVYAFQNAEQGDMFVQKSPASTVMELAQALKEIFSAENEIRIIGTRHGEKMHETLLTREEMSRTEDMGSYFRIVPDSRGLNYGSYLSEGEESISAMTEYRSDNARRLSVSEIKDSLLRLDFIQKELDGVGE